MIDVHCHLNFHKFEADVEDVIRDAREKGVTTIVNTGTSIPSSRLAVQLADSHDNMFAIVGIHPHHADKTDNPHPSPLPEGEGITQEEELADNWLEELEKIATSSQKVIGIGEIGMDYWNYRTNGIVPKDLQETAFRSQIELSIKLGLPLQIHNRLAWDDTLGILMEYQPQLQEVPGMFHCFSGSISFLTKVLEAGFYVGFDGNITYPGIPLGEDTPLPELVKYAPLDRIITETDSPFLTPVPLRGQRNMPGNIPLIVGEVAKIKGVPYNKVESQITKNFLRLFPNAHQ